jgi:cytochrome P450
LTEEIGTTIVERKKQDMEKGSTGKDLLSILMKANTSSEIAKEDRMSDAQVMAQITTFMLAGGETSSTALTLCLWRLAQHPEFQTRLRAEIRSVDTDRPTLDTVYKLPFLDNVVRESLRLDPPVPFTSRTTAHDVVIPLSMPIVGRDGTTMDSITVNKDTVIDIRE